MNVRGRINSEKIETRAFVDGEYVPAKQGQVMKRRASYDGTPLPEIASCGAEDVDAAVAAAKRTYESGVWKEKTPGQKKGLLLRAADLMEKYREELALLDTLETGRCFQNYYEDSIPKAIEAVRYFAEAADKLYDTAIPARGSEFGVVVRSPLGVVGLITPWNDPMVVSCWKIAPALLMGNSIVLKPAEQSSLSAIRLASILQEAGIPDGVFNVVPGDGETAGKALALHKDVRGISFTGSSAVGKQIIGYAGQSNMKRVTLECGGKGPYIVTANCSDIPRAAKVLAENMFYNQGQICSAPSRVIIHQEKRDEFIKCLKRECEAFVPGDPFETENNVGCVVSRGQFDKVMGYLEAARSEGIEVYQAQTKKPQDENACCIQPAILINARADSKAATEEIFGPVVAVIPVSSTEEALEIANNSEYGLAGAIWTDDINEAFYAAKNLETGLVHINSYGNDDNSSPFGGMKQSGLGKDKSIYAFDDFCDLKTVWMHFEKR